MFLFANALYVRGEVVAVGKWRPDQVPVPPRPPYKKPALPRPAPRPAVRSKGSERYVARMSTLSSFELSQLAKAVAAYRSGSFEEVRRSLDGLTYWPIRRLFAATHAATVYYLAAARRPASMLAASGSRVDLVDRLVAALPSETAPGRERVVDVLALVTAVSEGSPLDGFELDPFDACCDMLTVCACVLATRGTSLPAISVVLDDVPMPDPDEVG